jgi:translocation protein SEC63
MANYHYDEGGNMAAYFIISILALILTPLTLSLSPNSKKATSQGCQCNACLEQRERVRQREQGSLLRPKFSKKTSFIIAGWSLFAFLSYKVANAKNDNKVYDPFEVLGLSAGVTEKEIKSHFKKLSRMYHPDKFKATVNDTVESIANRFVDITKAYKSLTDETIRKNWELYGHPDGRQEVSMGLALPAWIIESKNNIWVLGIYGIVFGGALPALVGKWWFGSRQKTKDGVHAKTAAAFFTTVTEESTLEDILAVLSRAYTWDSPSKSFSRVSPDLKALEKIIASKVGQSKWAAVLRLAGVKGSDEDCRRRGLVLLYAHLLREQVGSKSLQDQQTALLLQTPTLLNALLTIVTSRNWLAPTLAVMRLHAHFAQALPLALHSPRLLQLPGVTPNDLGRVDEPEESLEEFVHRLETQGDKRVVEVKKAVAAWGRVEIADAAFRVIGERLVTPSSIVYLVLKLRISPLFGSTIKGEELDVEETKRSVRLNEEKDLLFLNDRGDAEQLPDDFSNGWAHAPYWPGNRKPGWWIVLGDDKSNRVVVPPLKITDIPLSRAEAERNFRAFKIQFQAPQGTGLFTWKVHLVSDTFIGEDITRDITLKIDDVSALNADEQGAEDEISEPDEDTLAGQMAAMRGGSVKKAAADEESDEESSTDDDQESGSDDSDSD